MKQIIVLGALFLALGTFQTAKADAPQEMNGTEFGFKAEAAPSEEAFDALGGNHHNNNRFHRVCYCESRSWATGLWYYWYSANCNYAYNMATAACVQRNGYTCRTFCRW